MWWQVLFWFLLVPTLVILGVVYGTSKKLYKLFYILAAFTYVIFIAYVIDVFSLGRNWILGLLVFSALLMLLLGYRLATREKRGKRARTSRARQNRRCWVVLAAILTLMLALIILGSLDTGFSREVQIGNLTRGEVLAMSGRVATFTYSNSFILPQVIPDQYVVACWYNTTGERVGPQLSVSVDEKEWIDSNEAFREVMPGETVVREVVIGGVKEPFPEIPEKSTPVQQRYRFYDALLLAASPERIDCGDLHDLTLSEIIPLR